MESPEEKRLTEQFRNDDVKAFRKIFEAFYAPLCYYASHILPDDQQASEAVQEVFIRIWEKRKSFFPEVSLRQYLFRSVRNQCLNLIRQEKVKQFHTGKYQETMSGEEAGGESVISRELFLQLEKSIDALPEKRREIFRLSRDEGLKYREIAERMGISVKTVEVQMGIALKTLREKIRKLILLVFL